jgi:hypothetical protein
VDTPPAVPVEHPPGLSVVLTLRAGDAAPPLAEAWLSTLKTLKLPFEVIAVGPGTEALATLADPNPHLRLLPAAGGTGDLFKLALAECRYALVLHTAADYPYTPGDIAVFLDRIDAGDERLVGQRPALVAGCRTGRAVPGFWQAVGLVYRTFLRVALGIPTEPLKGWLGFREHRRSWTAWVVYGVPFVDPNCAFKLYRKSALGRFPIQSHGDLVHVELAAKLTFLTCILDEVPLTPKPDAAAAVSWRDRGRLFSNPKFDPPGLIPAPPPVAEVPPPVPVP